MFIYTALIVCVIVVGKDISAVLINPQKMMTDACNVFMVQIYQIVFLIQS